MKKLGADGVILTKLDGDARGGAALSIKAVTGFANQVHWRERKNGWFRCILSRPYGFSYP